MQTNSLQDEIQKQGREIIDLKLRLEKIESLVSSLVSPKKRSLERFTATRKPRSYRRNKCKDDDDATESAAGSDHNDSIEDYEIPNPSHSEMMKGSTHPTDVTHPLDKTSDRVARRLTDAFDNERSIGSNDMGLSENSSRKRRAADKSKILGVKVEKMFDYIGEIRSYNGDMTWSVEFEDEDHLDLDEYDIIDSLARFEENKGKKSNKAFNESSSSSLKESFSQRIESNPESVVGQKVMKLFLVDGEVVSFIGAKFGVSFVNGTILEMSRSEVDDCAVH